MRRRVRLFEVQRGAVGLLQGQQLSLPWPGGQSGTAAHVVRRWRSCGYPRGVGGGVFLHRKQGTWPSSWWCVPRLPACCAYKAPKVQARLPDCLRPPPPAPCSGGTGRTMGHGGTAGTVLWRGVTTLDTCCGGHEPDPTRFIPSCSFRHPLPQSPPHALLTQRASSFPVRCVQAWHTPAPPPCCHTHPAT